MSEQSDGTVRVLLFSALREAVGVGELNVPLPDPPTGEALLDGLALSHPAVARFRPVVRLAVNQTYAASDTPLCPDDEIALITPVSGG